MTRLNAAQRAEIAERLTVPGQSARGLAAEYGVSHTAIVKAAKSVARGRQCGHLLTDHESAALDRSLAAMHSDDGRSIVERWSVLDIQQCLFALRRLREGMAPDGQA